MDPVTQGALGAAAAQAAFGRRLPRAAALVGAAAGMAADLDVLLPSGGDPVAGLIYHRHFTHSLLFIPIGGLLASLPFVWWKWFRGARLQVVGAAVAAYATHGLLDAFTSYGTLLLWPFSDRRVAWDWIGIVDPAYTLPLIVGVVWALLRGRRRAAVAALLVSSAYMCFGGWQHRRALGAQRALAEARGHPVEHGRVMPAPGALLMWRSVYASGGRLYVDGLRLPYAGEALAREGGSGRVASFDELPEAARGRVDSRRVYDVFVWFADGLVTPLDGRASVLGDQRFAADMSSMTPLWGMDFGTSPSDTPRRWRPPGGGLGGFAGRLWQSLIRGDPGYVPVRLVGRPGEAPAPGGAWLAAGAHGSFFYRPEEKVLPRRGADIMMTRAPP